VAGHDQAAVGGAAHHRVGEADHSAQALAGGSGEDLPEEPALPVGGDGVDQHKAGQHQRFVVGLQVGKDVAHHGGVAGHPKHGDPEQLVALVQPPTQARRGKGVQVVLAFHHQLGHGVVDAHRPVAGAVKAAVAPPAPPVPAA
jgi:hypothetical protein